MRTLPVTDAARPIGWWHLLARQGTIAPLVVLVASFSIASPYASATQVNLMNVLSQASILLIISAGLTVCHGDVPVGLVHRCSGHRGRLHGLRIVDCTRG